MEIKSGDIVVANNGNNDFYSVVDFIEDGYIYFNSGDDQYRTSIEDATFVSTGKWRLSDYD